MKNQAKRNKNLKALKEKMPPLPVFILVRPQMAENIGMAARAMMNCGVYDLRVVAPKQLPTDEKALNASSGADVILKNAKVYDKLDEAIADLEFIFATTARSRAMDKPVITTSDIKSFFEEKKFSPDRIGILFGCERTGLENSELSIADSILTIPLNPEHSSLNLSQAVLLIAYEFQKALAVPFVGATEPENHLASKRQVQTFLSFLNDLLDEKGYYFSPDKRDKMATNLANIFLKSTLTEQEINTLYGVLKHLK